MNNTSVLGFHSWSTLIHLMPCSQSELSEKIRSYYSSFSGLESNPKFACLLIDSYLYSPQQSAKWLCSTLQKHPLYQRFFCSPTVETGDDWLNHCPFFLLLIGEAGKRKQHFSNSCEARELDVMGSAYWMYLFKIWNVEIRQGHIYVPSFWFLLSGKAKSNTWGFFAAPQVHL